MATKRTHNFIKTKGLCNGDSCQGIRMTQVIFEILWVYIYLVDIYIYMYSIYIYMYSIFVYMYSIYIYIYIYTSGGGGLGLLSTVHTKGFWLLMDWTTSCKSKVAAAYISLAIVATCEFFISVFLRSSCPSSRRQIDFDPAVGEPVGSVEWYLDDHLMPGC